MASTRDTGRRLGITGMKPSDTTSPACPRSGQTVPDNAPAADDVDVLQLDASDVAFIELADPEIVKVIETSGCQAAGS